MTSNRLETAKRIFIIALSSCMLLFVSGYFIFCSTVVNPRFYEIVFSDKAVIASFGYAAEQISRAGPIKLSSQSLINNTITVIDGFIRFVVQKDMSLSSISIEEENISSIPAVVLATTTDSPEIPQINRIHPYVFTYLMPESEDIYSLLYLIQKGFSVARFICPGLCIAILLLLLFSDKTAENARTVLFVAGFFIIGSVFLFHLVKKPLLIAPLSNIMPDSIAFTKPIINAMTCVFSVRAILQGILYCFVALLFTIPLVQKNINKYSGTIAIFLVFFTGIVIIIFHAEIASNAIHSLNTNVTRHTIRVLHQGEDTVHSLVIKLREEGSGNPIPGVNLVINQINSNNNSLFLSIDTDAQGNARFILPEGQFLLYADPFTVPNGFSAFEPVTLSLTRPDNSLYTFYLSRVEETNIMAENPDEVILNSQDPPLPLLN